MHPDGGRLATLALAAVLGAASCNAGPSPSRPLDGVSPSPSIGAPSSPAATPTLGGPCPTARTSGPRASHWWDERVFYELFVRSFADSNGDGIGDLRGLTARLNYLNDGDPATSQDLGVTALWLMPVQEAASYHGYDPIDYERIDPAYGTNEDFRAFVRAAHARGMAVIVDLVLNHTSHRHPWFVDAQVPGSAHDDWYVWADSDPGYAGPWGEQIWFPAGGRWYLAIFSGGQPDLNLALPAVTSTLHDVAAFWLTEMGIDGFRLDAAKHLIEVGRTFTNTPETHRWLRELRTFVRDFSADPLLVGEILDDTEVAASYGPDEVDLAFEFQLAEAMVGAARGGDGTRLAQLQARALACFPGGRYAAFLSNHDQERVMSQLLGRPEAAAVAASLLLTNPGVPFIYYGEELGIEATKPDERLRAPFPWTPVAPGVGFTDGVPWEPAAAGFAERNVATESDDQASLLSVYRRLIRLRQAHTALSSGDTFPVASDAPGVYAQVRASESEVLLVVVNLSRDEVTDYRLALERGPLRLGAISELVYGPAGSPLAPQVTLSGGFLGYRPLATLAPASLTILRLGP